MLLRLRAARTPAHSPAARSHRGTALAVAAALVIAPTIAVVTASPAAAANGFRDFTPSFSMNTNGDILMAANTLETCVPSGACTTALNATSGNGSSYNNNGLNSRFVDVDANPATFNSSTADLTIPSNGSVLYALLVWAGRTTATSVANADLALRDKALFTLPNGAGTTSVPVTATQLDAVTDVNGVAYQATLDVTDLVAAAGSGTYAMANVQSSVGGMNQYAGWALVVAVSDPTAPARNLTVFTGFSSVGVGVPPGVPSLDLSVSGFLTPPNGPVKTTLGAITYEGDMGSTGDGFKLNGNDITDALNPSTNAFNSTISNRGAQVTTRNPAYNNQLGYDADLYAADGKLTNGATSATLTLTTSGEQFFPGVVTFATDLYEPKLIGTKSVVDLNGGTVVPGDVLRYTVPVQNVGLDVAKDSRFFDAVPTGTTYIPGTITVDGAAQTDADDAGDTAHYSDDENGHVSATIGTGATSALGGTIAPSASPLHTVTFDVLVDAGDTDGQELVNAAVLTYRGQTTGVAASSATNAVIRPVVTTPTPGNLPPSATPAVLGFTPTTAAPGVTIPVLAGDTDPEGDALTVIGVTDPAGGTATINPDGTVTYTPFPGFAGRDAFTYTITDTAGNRSTAIVQVDVLNSAPNAADDAVTVPAGLASPVTVLTNDTDPNGDVLTVRSADAASTQGGTVSVVNGVVTYSPKAGFSGTDSFHYVVQDSRGATDTATVTVTVNAPPSAVLDADTTPTDTAVDVAVLGNDSDPEGDTLTVTGATDPTHGSAVVNAAGTVTYTPDAGFAGVDTFDYTITDGTSSDTATVTITVSNAPPVAGDDTASTPVNTAVTVTVLGNDTDPNIPGTAQSLRVTSAGGDHGATVVVNAGSTLTVTPAAGYKGPITVTYTVSDGVGGTDTGELVVTVANGVPSAVADVESTPYLTPVTVDVRGNDSDPNGDPITIVAGSLTAPVDGAGTTTGTAVIDSGRVAYTPPAGFSGTVTFDYTLTDGTATASATVTVVVADAPPVAHDDVATTATGTPVTVDVLGNDTDPNVGATTQALEVSGAAADHGATVVRNVDGTLTVTPAPGYRGPVTVTYTVSDGAGGTDTGELVVTVRNAPPVAVDDAATTPYTTPVDITVRGNDSDPNGDPITVVAGSVTAPVTSAGTVRGTVTVTGGIATYTPPAGFSGIVTFDYTITDGTDTDTATVTVTVGNAPPVAAPDTAATKPGTPITIDVTGNDNDPDGDTLTITGFTQPATGTVTLVDGHLVYTPAPGFAGTITFTYTATDGQGGTTTGTVTVIVAADATTGTGTGTGGSPLAHTGTEIGLTAAIAALLLTAGLALVLAARRRRA